MMMRSVISSSMSAHIRPLTQKPALDIHLDNKRSVTAAVGRMSNGTAAPMTSFFRLCISSLGARVSVCSDIFGTSRTAAHASVSQLSGTVDDQRTPWQKVVPSF